MNELALFAGIGGGILGGKLHGWRTVCAVERDEHAASILAARQNDGHLEPFPIWDDVRTFDGKPWRGIVDVVSGGFPCQDISKAGGARDGISGSKSGLWVHMVRIIGEVRPSHVFVENAPALIVRGLGTVLGDLAALGYDAEWGVLGARHLHGPHERDRLWIRATCTTGELSNSNRFDDALRRNGTEGSQVVPYGGSDTGRGGRDSGAAHRGKTRDAAKNTTKWGELNPWRCESIPRVLGASNGASRRLDRQKAIGNAQVPAVAALAWEVLGK